MVKSVKEGEAATAAEPTLTDGNQGTYYDGYAKGFTDGVASVPVVVDRYNEGHKAGVTSVKVPKDRYREGYEAAVEALLAYLDARINRGHADGAVAVAEVRATLAARFWK